MLSNNSYVYAQCAVRVTIFSNSSIIPPDFKFTKLHALTLAARFYVLLFVFIKDINKQTISIMSAATVKRNANKCVCLVYSIQTNPCTKVYSECWSFFHRVHQYFSCKISIGCGLLQNRNTYSPIMCVREASDENKQTGALL